MIKEIAFKVFAALVHRKNQKWIQNPIKTQLQIFNQLIQKGSETKFGKDHSFKSITKIRNHLPE